MSGLPIDAAQALDFGLVNHVVPPDELMPQVLERARVIAGKAPLSVKALKKVVRGGAALPRADLQVDLSVEDNGRAARLVAASPQGSSGWSVWLRKVS